MTTEHDLERRRLDQVCPRCGRWEAAGPYCTGCLTRTGPDDWYPKGNLNDRKRLQKVAGKITLPPIRRGRGRPRRVEPLVQA